jgi:chitinase
MIHHPVDVASRVSPRLSELLRSRVNDPDGEQPVTLIAVRHFLADLLPSDFREAERLHHFDVEASLLDEMDTLIEEYGEDVLAVDFVQANASEQLSRVIEALVNDENRENPPTLGAVRDAIVAGLGTRLVGEGVLEDDEDDTLLSEIDALIEQFGADSLAEELLRYE